MIALALRPVRGKRRDAIPREFAMTLRHSFWPSKRDSSRSIAPWDEPPGRAPAWIGE